MRYVSPYDPAARTPVRPPRGPTRSPARTVALLDISKNRGAEFLDRIELRLRERGAEVERSESRSSRGRPRASWSSGSPPAADLAVEGLAD